MRKFLIVLTISCLAMATNAQTWVAFTQPNPEPVSIEVTTSTAQQVSFNVEVPGMFSQTIQQLGETYQRLQIPGADVSKEQGEPELPYIAKYVAIPECTDVQLSVNATGTTTFNNYTVYPAPAYQEVNNTDGTVYLEEVFTKSAAAYADNRFVTGTDAEVVSIGYLRDQKYALVHVYPLQFNAVTQQVVAKTNFTLSLQFTNATTDVNINTGIFNNVATHTLINYQNGDMKATVNDNVERNGNVQWVTLTSPADADNIAADYLIICADPFFEPGNPNSEVLRIANHRAQYNGFDVAIVNVYNVLDLFIQTEPNQKERAIRRFTKAVYEGSNAQHTYDGKLGYVLLIGDVDAGNTGMPTSYDHAYSAAFDPSDIVPSDYYFSCVTENQNSFDQIGDLFIGRFSVDNNSNGIVGLHNIIEKTIRNETEFIPQSKDNVHAYNGTAPNEEYYVNHYHPYLDFITQSEDYSFVNYFDYSNDTDLQNAYKQMADNGSSVLIYNGHGSVQSWEGSISNAYMMGNVDNSLKTPFTISLACLTGYFDHSTYKCMGEEMTTYSSDKGFVGFLGSGRVTMMSYQSPIYYPPYVPNRIQTALPHSIYYNLSFVAGEFILESKINSWAPHRFMFNYFGDPALNVMAQGYQITQNLVLNEDTEVSSDLRITNNAIVEINNDFIISNGSQITIEESCSLVLSENTNIVASQNSKIIVYGTLSMNNQSLSNLNVDVKDGGELIILDEVTFNSTSDLNLQSGSIVSGVVDVANKLTINGDLNSLNGVTFNDISSGAAGEIVIDNENPVNITSCQFNSSNLKGHLYFNDVDIAQTSFNGSYVQLDIFTNVTSGLCEISDNTFENLTGSGAKPIPALRIEDFPMYRINGNTFRNSTSDGIAVYNSGNVNYPARSISNNQIYNNSGKGVIIYSSVASIYDNRIYDNDYGIATYHNSNVKINGSVASLKQGVYQMIYNNEVNQVLAGAQSFPWYFTYNVIREENSSYPRVYSTDGAPQSPYNIEGNCWGDNFNPLEDLAPLTYYDYYPIWDCGLNPGDGTLPLEPRLAYETSLTTIEEENFAEAESQLKTIITTWPESSFAGEAMKTLQTVAVATNTLDDLITYYNTNSTIQQSEGLSKLAGYIVADCKIIQKEYQDALSHYEDIISNPPTEEDYIYAVIDAGRVQYLMEQEGGKASVSFKYAKLIPPTKNEYKENRRVLLEGIKGEEVSEDVDKPAISELVFSDENIRVYPNPAKNQATIEMNLGKQSNVTIELLDISGKLIKQARCQTNSTGKLQYKLSTAGLDNGVYFIKSSSNNSHRMDKIIVVK
jgi:tetratricopeptide (TPR) repeat protein